MERLSHLLPKVLQKRGLHGHAVGAQAVHVASKWMSEKLPHLQPVVRVLYVKDGTLFIACTHSVALMECQAVADQMLQFIRLECPMSGVRDVRMTRE